MYDVKVALREWDADASVVERRVDALQDEAVVAILRSHRHPYHHFQVDTAVAKFTKQYADRVMVGVFLYKVELGNGLHKQLAGALDVGAIGHAHVERVHLVAVVLGHVLVVLGEELTVLEGNHRPIDRFHHRTCVTD